MNDADGAPCRYYFHESGKNGEKKLGKLPTTEGFSTKPRIFGVIAALFYDIVQTLSLYKASIRLD